jgi:hypothetical protein
MMNIEVRDSALNALGTALTDKIAERIAQRLAYDHFATDENVALIKAYVDAAMQDGTIERHMVYELRVQIRLALERYFQSPEMLHVFSELLNTVMGGLAPLIGNAEAFVHTLATEYIPNVTAALKGRKDFEESEWHIRTYNALKAAGIESLLVVSQMTEAELRRLPNIGTKTIADIRDVLARRGYNPSLGVTKCQRHPKARSNSN